MSWTHGVIDLQHFKEASRATKYVEAGGLLCGGQAHDITEFKKTIEWHGGGLVFPLSEPDIFRHCTIGTQNHRQ